MRPEGKRILVTVAGQAMGRASALACEAEGAEVIVTDRHAALLEGLSKAAIEALATDTAPLDELFNCAGIVYNGTVLDISNNHWALSLDVNLSSVLRMTQAFLPGMLRRAEETGTAAILNMASIIEGFPNRTAYGATKAGMIGLAKSVAADYVGQGPRVNALCPGKVDTPSLRGPDRRGAGPGAGGERRRRASAQGPTGDGRGHHAAGGLPPVGRDPLRLRAGDTHGRRGDDLTALLT